MFGFIKNLFGSIAAFISGLFGGKKSKDDNSTAPKLSEKSQDNTSTAPKTKKSKGYYLELDDSGNIKTEAKAAVALAEPPKAEKPEPAKAAKVEKPEPAKAEPAKAKVATAKAPKVTVPAENGKEVKIEAQPNPPAPEINGKVAAANEGTFAPKYLLPTPSKSRRRPGPSMDAFRDMARQVKTPG